jgi:hypothetical protein
MSKHSSPLIVADCKPNQPNQFNLPLPDGLEDQLNPDQAKKVTKVQVKFALGVGQLLTKSFGEVSQILDDKPAPQASKTKAST